METNSSGEFYPGEEETPLFKLITELDCSQANLFQATQDLVKSPTEKKLEGMNETINANGSAFFEVINEIVFTEETTKEEKCNQITGLLISTDEDRVNHFRKIMPKGKFARMPESHNSLNEKINNRFDANEDLNNVCAEVMSIYAQHLTADANVLFESVTAGNRHKFYQYVDKAKENAFQVGAISLGVAIGGIIANRVVKKLDS